MKIRREGTDQELTLNIFVNNLPIPEYHLAPYPKFADENGYIDTYIPVVLGDRLTLKWAFQGSFLHCQMDFIADGTLVAEHRSEGDSKKGEVKFYKRGKLFDKSLDCPIPPGWTSIEPPKDVFEGELVVEPLAAEEIEMQEGGGKKPGVGSLLFVASVNQNTRDVYDDPGASLEFGSWKKRMAKGEKVREGDIEAEYKLDLQKTFEHKVSQKKSNAHRKRLKEVKFGTEPWGRFCFYYRSQKAIEVAGGIVRNEDLWLEVEGWPADGKAFITALPLKKKSATTTKKDAAVDDDDGEGSALFVDQGSPEPGIKQEIVSDRGSVLAPSPKLKQPKKRKLGGPLLIPTSPEANVVAATTEGDDENQNDDGGGGGDEGYIEPTEAELAADSFSSARSDNINTTQLEPLNTTNTSRRERIHTGKLDYFDQQDSEASESLPVVDNRAPSIRNMNWNTLIAPSGTNSKANSRVSAVKPIHSLLPNRATPPLHSSFTATNVSQNTNNNVKSTKRSGSKPIFEIDFESMATDTSGLNVDSVRVPQLTEIEREVEPVTGTSLDALKEHFRECGPYSDNPAAWALYKQRLDKVAAQKGDGGTKYYLLSEIAASVESKPAVRKPTKPKKQTNPAAATTQRRENKQAVTQDVISPPPQHTSFKKREGPSLSSPTPDKRAKASVSATPASGTAPGPARATPASRSTPGGGSKTMETIKDRKARFAQRKQIVENKKKLVKQYKEEARMLDEAEAELEMEEAEADEALAFWEQGGDVDDDGEED